MQREGQLTYYYRLKDKELILQSLWAVVEGFFGYIFPKPERIWMKRGI